MKKIIRIGFALGILGILALGCAHQSASRAGYCGQTLISLGDRYSIVLNKCGEADEYYYYRNNLGLRLGTRLTYGQTEEEHPVYVYFDRWGKCIKIEPVPPPMGLDVLPSRIGGQQRGPCQNGETVSVGSRLKNVLSRCGQPDDYADFMDLETGSKRAVELKYNQVDGQHPIYFYFDRRAICIRIRNGGKS